MVALRTVVVHPANRVEGRVRVPGDKSISHRYALLAGLAHGRSYVHNYAPGGDCQATRACLEALGVSITEAGTPSSLCVIGRGCRGLSSPGRALDARNSGTTTRLLAGILSAHPFSSTIDGDDSLRARPMGRVVGPLTRMGARLETTDGHLPLIIHGGRLVGIEFVPEVPSAQVKSAVLLAGLQAEGLTRVREPQPTRDHTERALQLFGATLRAGADGISLEGGQALSAVEATVPGDISSATFWAVAAAALPGSDVTIEGVGLNPSRTAILDVVARAGALVEIALRPGTPGGEPMGDVRVRFGDRCAIDISPAEVPALIDELPALAALGSFGGGIRVAGAGELRVKESDRITALATGLRALGADVDEWSDGFHVRPGVRLRGGTADSCHDHRLAMSFALAAVGASGPSTIVGAEAVDVSYPGFFEALELLAR